MQKKAETEEKMNRDRTAKIRAKGYCLVPIRTRTNSFESHVFY